SGPAHPDLAAACDAMTSDVDVARKALAPWAVELVGIGLDPRGSQRRRVIDLPRYRAMEQYFDSRWPAGRTMMRSTAAIQVNLDVGTAEDVDRRWQRAHDLGPMLAAAFANSPFDANGNPTGWRSSRLAVWEAIDPCRTAPAHLSGISAAAAWERFVLAAPVMMIRVDDARSVALRGDLPLRRWVEEGHELGWPTLDDLRYHCTTLFPPVRPRGWLELRMIDALPNEWWPVAVAVTTALLDDEVAAEAAAHAVAPVRDRWTDAARSGLAYPPLLRAAQRCFTVALEALPRVNAGAATIAATESFVDRYVARGRCPADERLHELTPLRTATA
ncbi:MAG TPA: glutamate-cysteine ligase family protein, partial [Acidimicrobiia bacterium]